MDIWCDKLQASDYNIYCDVGIRVMSNMTMYENMSISLFFMTFGLWALKPVTSQLKTCCIHPANNILNNCGAFAVFSLDKATLCPRLKLTYAEVCRQTVLLKQHTVNAVMLSSTYPGNHICDLCVCTDNGPLSLLYWCYLSLVKLLSPITCMRLCWHIPPSQHHIT